MKQSGFTLMEIVCVIVIISMLAAVSLPSIHKARNKAAIVKTKAIISSIEAAVLMYQTDMGNFPESNGSSQILIQALMGPFHDENWKGPYMRFKEKDMDDAKNIIDSWGNPLIYEYPQSKKENVPFLILSAGPDRKTDTKDDIGNW
ncbi:MAG TPA: type II secretion system protein GspG [bacterium]|nr:type II secretion system protein GspG [bacterium]